MLAIDLQVFASFKENPSFILGNIHSLAVTITIPNVITIPYKASVVAAKFVNRVVKISMLPSATASIVANVKTTNIDPISLKVILSLFILLLLSSYECYTVNFEMHFLTPLIYLYLTSEHIEKQYVFVLKIVLNKYICLILFI